jgi:hypothetical protein
MPDLHITRTADNKVMTINGGHIGDLVWPPQQTLLQFFVLVRKKTCYEDTI